MEEQAERKIVLPKYDLMLIVRDDPSYKWELIETPEGPTHIILEQELDGEYIDKLKVGAVVKVHYTKKIPGQQQLDVIETIGTVESFKELSERPQGDGLKVSTFRIKVKFNPN